MSNQPIINERDILLSTSVFPRTVEINGKQRTFYSVSVQRAYKKKGDADYTRESINLDSDDLLKMANLLTETYNEIRKLAITAKPAKAKTDDWGEAVIKLETNTTDDEIPF
jgi:hypothetical protein